MLAVRREPLMGGSIAPRALAGSQDATTLAFAGGSSRRFDQVRAPLPIQASSFLSKERLWHPAQFPEIRLAA
jgi:hypothetical protein